jgi:hypothetical protein
MDVTKLVFSCKNYRIVGVYFTLAQLYICKNSSYSYIVRIRVLCLDLGHTVLYSKAWDEELCIS